MKRVVRIGKGRKVQGMLAEVLRAVPGDADVDSLVEVIQLLIPLGLAAVGEALRRRSVTSIVGIPSEGVLDRSHARPCSRIRGQ